MVDDVVYVVGLELMQDGYDDGSVGKGGQEGNSPVRAVASAHGYLVAFLYTARFKDDV